MASAAQPLPVLRPGRAACARPPGAHARLPRSLPPSSRAGPAPPAASAHGALPSIAGPDERRARREEDPS